MFTVRHYWAKTNCFLVYFSNYILLKIYRREKNTGARFVSSLHGHIQNVEWETQVFLGWPRPNCAVAIDDRFCVNWKLHSKFRLPIFVDAETSCGICFYEILIDVALHIVWHAAIGSLVITRTMNIVFFKNKLTIILLWISASFAAVNIASVIVSIYNAIKVKLINFDIALVGRVATQGAPRLSVPSIFTAGQ